MSQVLNFSFVVKMTYKSETDTRGQRGILHHLLTPSSTRSWGKKKRRKVLLNNSLIDPRVNRKKELGEVNVKTKGVGNFNKNRSNDHKRLNALEYQLRDKSRLGWRVLVT